MSELSSRHALDLVTVSSDITLVAEKFGRTDMGVALLQNVILFEDLEKLQEEAQSISINDFHYHHTPSQDDFGVEYEENYWSYSFNYERKDQANIDSLPTIRALATAVENLLTKDLGSHFQRLRRWRVDELSIRHFDTSPGVGFHRWPARNAGAIAIAAIDGAGELQARDIYKRKALLPVEPGDVVLIRGNNLYSPNDPPKFMPEYSVTNVDPEGFTTLVIQPKAIANQSEQDDTDFDI